MEPLEKISIFVEPTTKHQNISKTDRDNSALPFRYEGLELQNQSVQCRQKNSNSDFYSEEFRKTVISGYFFSLIVTVR